MSVRKLTANLLTLLVLLSATTIARAQDPHRYLPPADPLAFDPDFQWFEPVYDLDLLDMKAKQRAGTGWYATYDRLMLYGSRPDLNEPDISRTRLDRGWGHRYQVGYMIPREEHGFQFVWTSHQVGKSFVRTREAQNRYNGDQVVGGQGGGYPTEPGTGFFVPHAEFNNFGYDNRFLDIRDSENVYDLNSYELNKTWRLEPYHYGGILEPLVGIRWMRVRDRNIFDFYDFVTANPALGEPTGATGDQITTDEAITNNYMFGGQVGFRYVKFKDRMIYTSDLKVFFGGSYQHMEADRTIGRVFYTGGPIAPIGAPTLFIVDDADPFAPVHDRNEEWFVGFDIRADVGYQFTRHFSARVGFQIIDIARGVWRGGNGTFVPAGSNDQDLVAVGATFGINLNH